MASRHERIRKRAHKLIKRWGHDTVLAILRREGLADRTCTVLEDAFTPTEIARGVALQGDRRFLVSALGADGAALSPPPDEQQDELIVPDPVEDSFSTAYRIVEPPGRLAPGPTVIYYELHCRGA